MWLHPKVRELTQEIIKGKKERDVVLILLSFDSNYKEFQKLRQSVQKVCFPPFSSRAQMARVQELVPLHLSQLTPLPPYSHTPASVTLAAQVLSFIITTNLPFFCLENSYSHCSLLVLSRLITYHLKRRKLKDSFVLFITKNHPITTGLLCWANKIWSQIFQAIKLEILPFAMTWMDLESFMLGEKKAQTNAVWPHLYVGSKK